MTTFLGGGGLRDDIEKARRREGIGIYSRSKGGVSGMVTTGVGHMLS